MISLEQGIIFWGKEKVGRVKTMINKWWLRLTASAVIAALIILLFAAPFGGRSGTRYESTEDFTGHLEHRIPALMESYEIPGVTVALIKEGKPAWSEAFGYADVEAGRGMTVDTVCRVESISKSVTAWGVMQLVEEERIDLDVPVREYLTSWSFPEQKSGALDNAVEEITVRRLLSAHAGLPLGPIGIRWSPGDETLPTLEERLTGSAVLFQEPGSSFYYSNVGYYVLELLIEEVSGRDFAEYMQNEVMEPLGMEESSFIWSKKFDPPVPKGYLADGEPVPVYVYPDKAAGGLFSPLEDIVSFVSAGMTEYTNSYRGVLKPESIEAMYTPSVDTTGYYGMVFDSYGFGHFIETLPTGEKAVSHGGQGTGWMTQFYSVPETGDGIVILSNSGRSWPFFSYVLSDWADWCGYGSVGFSLIVKVKIWLLILTGVLLALVLWRTWGIMQDLITRTRRFAPFSGSRMHVRIPAFVLFAVLTGGLLWVLGLPYFFLFSVVPIASVWLMYVLAASAFILLLSALLPKEENSPASRPDESRNG